MRASSFNRSVVCGLLLMALACAPALAQEWPVRPVQIIVPVPAGGGLDPFARAITAKLTDALKQRFLVDNKPGTSGSIGTAFVVTIHTMSPLEELR